MAISLAAFFYSKNFYIFTKTNLTDEIMKRPQEKDYFEYRGKTLIMDHGRAENFMDAQNDYIDYLEAQIKSQKSIERKSKNSDKKPPEPPKDRILREDGKGLIPPKNYR